jgi:valyl-tRNA synthetase
LWTFSTLGWPKETEDLKIFHPTSVLETGYDILFFWVARMILMTTSLLGQVPFRQVLLHGLVRDAEKQKMSKSKGNVIDPLELIDKYGTDSLRIALIFSTAAGSDIPMSEDKVRGMKYFSNKLWNIARFIKEFRPSDSAVEISNHKDDKAIIAKLEALKGTVTDSIDQFRLHDAAQELYQFIWHEFADVYLESVKERRAEAQPTLEYVFKDSLKLLHPFMPFITHELYSKFEPNESLMIQKWPNG